MKILLCGCCGRMGRAVTELARECGEEIVCGVDVCPAPMPYPVFLSFRNLAQQAEVVIDFSSPQNLEERLRFAEERAIGIVLAATGFSEADERLIKEYAKKIAIFKTGNLSLGVNVLQLLVKRAAQALGEEFDVEIIERHHNQKKDAPSGTALLLAESAEEGRGKHMERICGREGAVGARKQSEIGIHSVRGGNLVGEHEVMFAGKDEIITLSHSARSRNVFASGALRAAAWLIGKGAGIYDMNDLLKDSLHA